MGGHSSFKRKIIGCRTCHAGVEEVMPGLTCDFAGVCSKDPRASWYGKCNGGVFFNPHRRFEHDVASHVLPVNQRLQHRNVFFLKPVREGNTTPALCVASYSQTLPRCWNYVQCCCIGRFSDRVSCHENVCFWDCHVFLRTLEIFFKFTHALNRLICTLYTTYSFSIMG